MTILPTYEQIGITATYAITLCRAMQGLSFSTELIGTHLYLTETIKPPSIYPIVALSSVSFSLGGTIALIIAYFATSYSINWRSVFAFGILAAMIGITARVILQETKEFLTAKERKIANIYTNIKEETLIRNNDIKNTLAAFCMGCAIPVCFYFVYVYCGNILKHDFGLNSKQIIFHNLLISIIQLTFLSYKIPPLKIVKAKLFFFIIIVILTPFLITQIHSKYTIFFIQGCLVLFNCNFGPALPIIYKNISIYVSISYAAIMVPKNWTTKMIE